MRWLPRRVALVAAALALATLVSACSIPSRPAWWPKPKQSAGSRQHGQTNAQAAVPVVQHPWHSGMRQLGIQVYWTANDNDRSDSMVRIKARRIINYAISLNANSITVTIPFYTHGITSDSVYASPDTTPTPRHIEIFLQEALKSHMRVTLRPVLDEDALVAQNPLAWRGTIEPQGIDSWFASYRKLLMPYAEAAQAGHAATFVIGTELESLERASNWTGLVRSIKSVYSGQLVYDENFDEFAIGNVHLPLKTYDVDAYPRFSLPDSASVKRLARAWDDWLGTHPLTVRRKLTLSEIGIDAVAGSYPDPAVWIGTVHSPIDTRVQANWYRAVCRAVQRERVGGGLYWWEVSFDADPAHPGLWQSDRLTFLGRPAQLVIKGCFAKLSS